MIPLKLDWKQVYDLVEQRIPKFTQIYGVPRGGAIVAGLTGNATSDLGKADCIVDDIIDSGATRNRYRTSHPHLPFHALVDKTGEDGKLGWVQFPWEENADIDAETNIVRLLEFLGEDPNRPGLIDTPRRVIKAWKELTKGYAQDPDDILGRVFPGDGYDEMIVSRNIPFHSTCEHHMLPFHGHASVGYVPKEGASIVGLSKLARLVDCFAARLQVQERLTSQVAEAVFRVLAPEGVGVVVTAQHMCMSCRGIRKHDTEMVTSSMLGCFRQAAARAEFLAHHRGGA